MSIRISLFLLILLSLTGCAINSNLTIPANETFVLGGNGNGRFKAKLTNSSNQAVIISSENEAGIQMLLDTLQPGETTKARFQKGDAALLSNTSASQGVMLQVHITGSLNLGMAYETYDN